MAIFRVKALRKENLKRDYKGNYRKAFDGSYDNFFGVTKMYQTSECVELILHTDINTIDECANILLEKAIKGIAVQKNKDENGCVGR